MYSPPLSPHTMRPIKNLTQPILTQSESDPLTKGGDSAHEDLKFPMESIVSRTRSVHFSKLSPPHD